MVANPGSRVSEVLPKDAWHRLHTDPTAQLIDVRTAVEWTFVGVPHCVGVSDRFHLVEWIRSPDMTPNPGFVAEVRMAVGEAKPSQIMFICRSGVRSLSAAYAVAEATDGLPDAPLCLNVQHGFEGDLNEELRRGTLNGWKADDLPWRQS